MDHDLDDSLNRIYIGLMVNTWMKYRSYSHISIWLLSLYSLRPFLSLLLSSPVSFPCFYAPPFPCLLYFFDNSKTPTIHFSLLLSSPFPFSPLISFSSLLSFFAFLPFLSLSLPANFWCGDRRHAAPLPTGLHQGIVSTRFTSWGIPLVLNSGYQVSWLPCHTLTSTK